MAGREDEGDQGGGEEHLDDGDVAIVTAEYLGERIGVVDAEPSRRAFAGGESLAKFGERKWRKAKQGR